METLGCGLYPALRRNHDEDYIKPKMTIAMRPSDVAFTDRTGSSAELWRQIRPLVRACMGTMWRSKLDWRKRCIFPVLSC